MKHPSDGLEINKAPPPPRPLAEKGLNRGYTVRVCRQGSLTVT